MTDPRVLFAGTPEFSLASLQALADGGTEPVAVLTQPDRPAGRGRRVVVSPVKRFAIERDIPLLQPTTLRDAAAVAAVDEVKPDIMIVAAYGLILPQEILDIPTAGCLNVHASLLPRWRGAAPIQAAILAGDELSGISLMSMTAGLDCGPVYAQQSVEIAAEMTAGDLHDRLAKLGGELLNANLNVILSGALAAKRQDDSRATYAGKILKRDAELDWHKSAEELQRRVRAYNPVPGAWFVCNGEQIKCLRALRAPKNSFAPGTVMSADRDGIVIACGDGALSLQELKRPGKGLVTAGEFAAQVDLGDRILEQA